GTPIHPCADRDGSTTMLDCVRDQVVESLGESQPVAVDHRRPRRAADIDPATVRRGRRTPRLGAVSQQRGKVHVTKALRRRRAAAHCGEILERQGGTLKLELYPPQWRSGQPASPHAQPDPQASGGDRASKFVGGARDRLEPSAATQLGAQSQRHREHGQPPPHESHAHAHGSVPSTNRYPTPHTLTTKRSPATESFRRSREAWESKVRVMPMDLYPHTPRRSSSRVKTRVGSPASARSNAYSFFDSLTSFPCSQT